MKTKIVSRQVGYTKPGSAQAARVYAGKPIKTSKMVIKGNGKVKTVTYGPINRIGRQTKTKTISKGGLTF